MEAGETDRSVTDILAGRGDEADQDTWNAASWWLYDYLLSHGSEAKAREVMDAGKAAGHSKDALKRASLKLAVAKRRDGFQGPWVWQWDVARSKQPTGPRPMSAKGAQGAETATPMRPMRSLAKSGNSRSPKGKAAGSKVVPIRPAADDQPDDAS